MTFYISIFDKNKGNLGNRIFMYMYAILLQKQIPGSEIVNFSIDEFGIDYKENPLDGRILDIRGGHKHSINEIAYLANQGIYDALYFHGFVQRMEYYPSVNFCSSLFPASGLIKEVVSDREILINVRGAEILKAIHPDYIPVPVDFMEQVVRETGLTPVIMGQIGDDFYSREIINRFPKARILKHVSTLNDFDIIRNSTNIILSISTFSWVAAWLSNRNKNIYMPLLGIFNPIQRKDIDLLPIGDLRYHFYEFPIFKWQGNDENISYICGKGKEYNKVSHLKIKEKIFY